MKATTSAYTDTDTLMGICTTKQIRHVCTFQRARDKVYEQLKLSAELLGEHNSLAVLARYRVF